MESKTKSRVVKIVVAIVTILIVSIFGLRSCGSVGRTYRGVITTFGRVGDEVLQPGLHFKSPIGQKIVKWDISPIEYERTFSVGSDGAISKDLQTVGMTFTLYWKYDETRIIDIAKNYSDKEKIYQPISSAVKAAIKNEIGKYSIEEIIANQATITQNVRATFESNPDIQRLPIIIQSFVIGNYDWDEQYDKMIKETMNRKQQVEQMKQEVALSEQSAQKQVKEAEAEKQRVELESEAALVKAQKEAEAQVELAKGEAEAKKVKAEAEKYEAQQIAQAAEMKRAQWAHEEKMKAMEVEAEKWKHWDGDLNPKYVPITASGTIVDLPAGKQ